MARMGCNRLALPLPLPAEDDDDDAAEEEEGVLMGDPSLLRLTRDEFTGDADIIEINYLIRFLQNNQLDFPADNICT